MRGQETEVFSIFWGDTHHNTYTSDEQDPSLAEVLSFTRTYLDFYTGAYYTPIATGVSPREDRVTVPLPAEIGHVVEQSPIPAQVWRGIRVERTKAPEVIAREWAEFQEVTATYNSPGGFVVFPGYEWQGDGSWGDHNVIYKSEGLPVYTVMTIAELYDRLRGCEALAIPHHTGYHTGIRAPLWAHCDERISPFAEIFSVHGCSETDEEWVGLRRNSHMGPGTAGSTYQDALDAGLHLGAICSTDNWTNVPGCWGQGLMACLARELTRGSLWDAFRKRRVYGVTGDRIELNFTCNGAPMGSILEHTMRREIRVEVRGVDALDRIEILRNGLVVATYCHQGTWDIPPDGTTARFKIRIEPGWGPRIGELPFLERHWSGELSLSRGRFVGWHPCWIGRNQQVPQLDGKTARFAMVSSQLAVPGAFQGGIVFEFETDPAAEVLLLLNGKEVKDRVRAFAQGSRILWYREESSELLRDMTGIDPDSLERKDPLFYHFAFKAKLHRVIPEQGFSARFSIMDTDELSGETNYRVRVEQRNGQRAWSSPIWVKGK